MHEVIVINAFHRGDWFIDQLVSLGKKVQVFDWSEKMGERSDSEIVGPFGIFGEEKISADLISWMDKNFSKTLQDKGWCAWSQQGTFESQGPFRVQQFFKNEKWVEPLFKSFISKIDWPVKKWHELETKIHSAHDYWCLSAPSPKVRGISLLPEDTVEFRVSREQKTIRVNQEEWQAPFFVFFLNSYEMAPFYDEQMAALVRGETLRPRLCWQMMKVQITTEINLSQMPMRSLLLNNVEDPWVEDHFLVLNKTQENGVMDIWYRSYFDFHQKEDYFLNLQQEIFKNLKNKFSASDIECLQKPRELLNEKFQSLFPIYEPGEWERQSSWYADGLFYVGPEKVSDFLFSTYWALQNLILQTLKERNNNNG